MVHSNLGVGADSGPIEFKHLEHRVAELRSEYQTATPWPHLVLDDFLRGDVAARGAATFPRLDTLRLRLARLLEARAHEWLVDSHDPAIASIFEALQGERFTAFLKAITGISDLAPDRQFVGAGLHQGARGSYLHVHADHNTHPDDPTCFRRVNVLLYLNDRWERNWNGDLELWDRTAGGCCKRIEPKFNRCAILLVDDTAFHGYGPLRVPHNGTRKAIASYYYSNSPAAGQSSEPHPTTLPALGGESFISVFAHGIRRKILHRIEKTFRM
jgi:hypothetical protein